MAKKRLSYDIKARMVQLSGACFWYWNSFHSFMESSGVPRSLILRYPKEAFNKYDVMRNVLTVLEETDRFDTMNRLVSNFYQLKGAVDRDNLDNERAKQLLNDFRAAVGNDPIESEIRRRETEKRRRDYRQSVEGTMSKQQRLDALNTQFLELSAGGDMTPQQRGFALESLFIDLLHLEEFECRKPFRNPGREQIDGRFKFEKFDYLVEVKWTSSTAKQEDLSIFDGKIRGKAQSTRGLFLAANGFDENAVAKFSGDKPRILLMTGEDLALVLNGTLTMQDVMKAKIDAIVDDGVINYPARSIRSGH